MSGVQDLIAFVKVADVARSIAFYETLGFTVADSYTRADGVLDWASLESASARLMLAQAGPPSREAAQAVIFYLYSADLPALRARLLAAGIAAGEIVDGTPGPREEMRVRDPDGYCLMIAQVEEPAARRPVEVVRRCLDAARRRDLATVRDLLDPQVRWHGDGDVENGCHDRDEVLAFLARALEDGAEVELDGLVEVGELVVALMRPDTTVVHVRDGRVAEIVVHSLPERALASARAQLHEHGDEPRAPGTAEVTGSSPVLLVSDLPRAVAYYRDRLGFACDVHGDPPDFCVARRGEARILLALCDDAEKVVPNWRLVHNMWDAYVRVSDADAIYAEVRERGAPIDYTIYDAPHGFREFGVQDPDGHDIAFGQPIGPS